MSKILITVEVFLSCAVLIVAGGLIIAVNAATHANYGVEVEGYLTARFTLFSPQYPEMEKKYQFHQQLISQLKQQPGVTDVTIGSSLPGRNSGREPIVIEGREATKGNATRVLFLTIDQRYFGTLGAPIIDGRDFDGRDTRDSQKVVVVSATFAQVHFPNESAIGKRIKINPNDKQSEWLTIVGVVKHLVHQQPFGDAFTKPVIYVPNSQLTYSSQYVAIKVSGDPYMYQKMLVDVVGKLDPEIPMYNILSFEERLYRRVLALKFVGNLFIIFGVLALILAAAGIYGVMSQNVTRRTQEFGVRRALGATEANIYRLLVKQSSVLLGIGLTLGSVVGFLGMQVISSNLMPLSHYYPTVTGVVLCVISIATMMATLLPAQKAMAIEPNNALRYE